MITLRIREQDWTMTMTTHSRSTSPKPPFLATCMYGQLWIVWSLGCRELISAAGNSIWYIIISSKLFTDYSCWSSPPWRISPWVPGCGVAGGAGGKPLALWLHCTTIQVTKRIGEDKGSRTRRGWAGQVREENFWGPEEYPMSIPEAGWLSDKEAANGLQKQERTHQLPGVKVGYLF